MHPVGSTAPGSAVQKGKGRAGVSPVSAATRAWWRALRKVPSLSGCPAPTRVLCAAGMGALLCLGACSPSLDWREVRPAGAAVVAMLPCKPNVAARTLPLAGAPVRLTMLACKADRLSWALAAADLGDPARVGPALNAMREGIRANLDGQVVELQPAAVRGATPHEAQARVHVRGHRQDGTPMAARVVVFSHGTQVFQAVVMGEAVPDGPASTFFDSLRAGL